VEVNKHVYANFNRLVESDEGDDSIHVVALLKVAVSMLN